MCYKGFFYKAESFSGDFAADLRGEKQMGVLVSDMLELKEFKGIVLLSGEEYIFNEIKGITIIEAPDIVKFIKGGEVLLTSLYAFMNSSMDEFVDYIEALSAAKISAMGIKRGRNIDQEEEKISFLLKFAQKNHFPLLEIPFSLSFKDIMSLIMERLSNEEILRLKYFKMTHDNFSALSFPFDSAENGVGVIIDVLSKMVDNPVSLYDQNGMLIATTDTRLLNLRISGKKKKYEPGFYSSYTYFKQSQAVFSDSEKRYTQYLIHFKVMYSYMIYLVVTETAKRLSDLDFIAIENASTVLKYELFRQYSINAMEKKYENDILNDILYGKIKLGHDLKKNAELLGLDGEAYYSIIVFTFSGCRSGRGEKHSDTIKYCNMIYDLVLRCFPKARVQNDINKVIVIQASEEATDSVKQKKKIKECIAEIQNQITLTEKSVKLSVGIGKEVKGLANVTESLKQAVHALAFINVLGQEIKDSGAKGMFYDELGIFELLSDIKDEKQLENYIPKSLKSLIHYKRPQRDDLLDTLKVYLEHNQNLAKTAQDLYIHYKTATYRVERITEITGIDFSDANEVLSVRIGLVVYKIMKNLMQ